MYWSRVVWAGRGIYETVKKERDYLDDTLADNWNESSMVIIAVKRAKVNVQISNSTPAFSSIRKPRQENKYALRLSRLLQARKIGQASLLSRIYI